MERHDFLATENTESTERRRGVAPRSLCSLCPLWLTFLLTFLAVCALAPATRGDEGADRAFDKVVDAYYADYSKVHPSSATDLGLHDHDSDLEDVSPEALKVELARLHSFAD